MNLRKKVIAPFAIAMTLLCVGTTVFAASELNIESINDNRVVLGKDADKEADGIAKISFDMGKTWVTESEYIRSENMSTEFWGYDEYKSYAETVEKDLLEMLAAGEPDLTNEDIAAWKENTMQTLEFINAGGKISKNTIGEDIQFKISNVDSSLIESISEKK